MPPQFEEFDPSSGGYYDATVLNDDRLPPGGVPGQILVKTSRADYYSAWMTLRDREAPAPTEGGTGASVGTTPPAAPAPGALWLNQNPAGKLEVFDGSSWREAYDMAGEHVAWARNQITNPQFDLWARNATSLVDNGTGPDLWNLASLGTTCTLTRASPNVFDCPSILICGRFAFTRGSGADRYCRVSQRLIGANAKQMSGGPMTLSFWAQASNPCTIGVDAITSGTFNGSYTEKDFCPPHTASLTATWKQFIYTFTPPSYTAQPFQIQPTLRFWFDAGSSDLQARFPGIGTTDANVQISNVQLEYGSVATAYEPRPVPIEQARCNRYFEIVTTRFAIGNQLAGDTIVFAVPYKVQKQTQATMAWRTTPTLVNVTSIVLTSSQQAAVITGVVEADGAISISGTIDASIAW